MAMTCPRCQANLPEDTNFCPDCGLPLIQQPFHPVRVQQFLDVVSEGNVEIAEEVLQHDARFANIRDTTIEHWPALSIAVSNTNIDEAYDMAETLLLYGADVNAVVERKLTTPLHTAVVIAIAQKNNSVVLLLLSHGANPNAQDGNGNTPLHAALALPPLESSPQMARWFLINELCRYGADPLIANKKGETPLSKIEYYAALMEPRQPKESDFQDYAEYSNAWDSYRKKYDAYMMSELYTIVSTLRSKAGKTDEKTGTP